MNTKKKNIKKNITKKKNSNKNNDKYRFTLKQYNSKDGMMTNIWGPSMWHTLHTISFNYPVKPSYNDKVNYKKFITNLKFVLPCGKCRENFRKNMKQLPLKMENMKSRYTFSKYVYKLHEVINTMLNKKSNLSYDDVRDRYEHFRARCPKKEYIKNELQTIKHIGCIEPLNGKKAKCILKLVPEDTKCDSFEVNIKKI